MERVVSTSSVLPSNFNSDQKPFLRLIFFGREATRVNLLFYLGSY